MEFSYLNPTRIEFGQGKINTISSFIPKTTRYYLYMVVEV